MKIRFRPALGATVVVSAIVSVATTSLVGQSHTTPGDIQAAKEAELATKALERDLARRWLERVGREGQLRRGNMTDDEVETVVERAVQESRDHS